MYDASEWKHKLEELSEARLPWKSIDAEVPETRSHLKTSRIALNREFHIDTQQQIDRCLSCTKMECNNCVVNENRKRIYAFKKLTIKHEYLEVSM